MYQNNQLSDIVLRVLKMNCIGMYLAYIHTHYAVEYLSSKGVVYRGDWVITQDFITALICPHA
jgi:hypothetical protein